MSNSIVMLQKIFECRFFNIKVFDFEGFIGNELKMKVSCPLNIYGGTCNI
jgi:hypothetical protein